GVPLPAQCIADWRGSGPVRRDSDQRGRPTASAAGDPESTAVLHRPAQILCNSGQADQEEIALDRLCTAEVDGVPGSHESSRRGPWIDLRVVEGSELGEANTPPRIERSKLLSEAAKATRIQSVPVELGVPDELRQGRVLDADHLLDGGERLQRERCRRDTSEDVSNTAAFAGP